MRFRIFSLDPDLRPNPEPILITITVRSLWVWAMGQLCGAGVIL